MVTANVDTQTVSETVTYEQFKDFIKQAKKAANSYYDTDVLLMSDVEYDTLVDRIADAKEQNPDWDDEGILTQVAAGVSAGGTLKHPQPLLSLEKTTDFEVMKKFVTGVPAACVVEMKLDGNAVRATYENGQLVTLATRGDGMTGEPLDTSLTIDGLPTKIDLKETVTITGEVYMTDTDFEKSNTNRIATGKPRFKNPRNAASGMLRRETKTFEAFLSFAAYHVTSNSFDTEDDYQKRMTKLTEHGVRTVQNLQKEVGLTTAATKTGTVVVKQVTAMETKRAELPIGIDGAVVKAVSYKVREQMGTTTRHPKSALAFKFKPLEATSYLAAIEVGVGRTGQLSLTAILNPPVELDGSLVERATLHNPAFIAEQKLGIGSRCLITKANDIIPRCVGALGEQPEGVVAWVPPATCPLCDQPWDKTQLLWKCRTETCGLANRIMYAASRDVLDIEGLGEEVAIALVEAGLVNNVADLFDLTVDQIATTPIGVTSTGNTKLIGNVVGAKIFASIQEAKKQPLNRIVCSLGISKMGRTMSRRLVAHFHTLENIRNANETAFMEVEGIAEEKARYYVEGFKQMSDVLDRMVAAGVTTQAETTDNATELPLAGKKVVVTGSMAGSALEGLNRTQMNELIERAGGTSSGSVSKATSLLVCGETGSSKHTKAVSLGVTIMEPSEFAKLVSTFL